MQEYGPIQNLSFWVVDSYPPSCAGLPWAWKGGFKYPIPTSNPPGWFTNLAEPRS